MKAKDTTGEVTGAKVRKIAGRLLRELAEHASDRQEMGLCAIEDDHVIHLGSPSYLAMCTLGELKSLCASALTQSPTKDRK